MTVPTPDEQHYSAMFWTALIAALAVVVGGVLLVGISACAPSPGAERPPKNQWRADRVAEAVYVQDARTGACFAVWLSDYSAASVITAVDCTPAVLQAVAEDTQP